MVVKLTSVLEVNTLYDYMKYIVGGGTESFSEASNDYTYEIEVNDGCISNVKGVWVEPHLIEGSFVDLKLPNVLFLNVERKGLCLITAKDDLISLNTWEVVNIDTVKNLNMEIITKPIIIKGSPKIKVYKNYEGDILIKNEDFMDMCLLISHDVGISIVNLKYFKIRESFFSEVKLVAFNKHLYSVL